MKGTKMKNLLNMFKIFAISLIVMTIIITGLSVAAAKPINKKTGQNIDTYKKVLTSNAKNIYIESLKISGSDITPDCEHQWSIEKKTLAGGKQDGVDIIIINNGKLTITMVPTRGMSIQNVVMDDIGLGWDSPVKEIVNPKYINLESRNGLGWLDGFNEWMVRCGLEFFGGPGIDQFVDDTGQLWQMNLTLHGKQGNTPASEVEIVVEKTPPYRIAVRGKVNESTIQKPNLTIQTEISTVPGSNKFQISDKITNLSAIAQEFGILYHTNFGPPLMEKDAKLKAPAKKVTPINEHSAKAVSTYNTYREPTTGFIEEVYCMILYGDKADKTIVMLENASGDKALSMAYSIKELPYFTLWKNPVAPEDGYVTGLEPGTGFPRNRSEERKLGRVPKLEPRQSRSFTIDYEIHDSREKVSNVRKQIEKIIDKRETVIEEESLLIK